ncbi:hypothetical protein LguiB_012192 [Lonicera macranthoides]
MAILMYNKMRARGTLIGDNYTFPFLFKACGDVLDLEKGREIHGLVIRIGFHFDKFLQSSLLRFYTVCCEIDSARQVFDEFTAKDVVFWNAMIIGYAQKGMVCEAFEVFLELMGMGEVKPNEGTILSLISACLVTKNLKLGREILGYVRKEMDFCVGEKLGAAFVDLFAKCGCLNYARTLFDQMPEKNTVAWNSLICGYSQSGSLQQAVEIFRDMCSLDVKPDRFTISVLLSVCAQTSAISLGNWIREFAEKNDIWDVFVGTSLVDMYGKCGFVATAREVFDLMPVKNVATWNSILSAYASHGHAGPVIELFNEMKELGASPDPITFLAILHACAHAGLVEEGRQYFTMMTSYKITPKIEHYGCMVDLLGRAGFLKEAKDLIEKMDIEPNLIVWGALLSACSIHGDVDTGEWAAHHIFKLDAMDGGSYVLLANLYASARRFDGVKKVRQMIAEKGIFKPPGCSMIEIDNVVHEFIVADKVHPRSQEIYLVLDDLSMKMKMARYMPISALDEEGVETSRPDSR